MIHIISLGVDLKLGCLVFLGLEESSETRVQIKCTSNPASRLAIETAACKRSGDREREREGGQECDRDTPIQICKLKESLYLYNMSLMSNIRVSPCADREPEINRVSGRAWERRKEKRGGCGRRIHTCTYVRAKFTNTYQIHICTTHMAHHHPPNMYWRQRLECPVRDQLHTC